MPAAQGFRFSDAFLISVGLRARPSLLRQLLPSPRLVPLRVAPGTALLEVGLWRHAGGGGLGPFDAVAISMPVSVDRPPLPLVGLMKQLGRGRTVFVWQLFVSAEEAREAALKWGLPASLARIEMGETGHGTTLGVDGLQPQSGLPGLSGEHVSCRVAQAGEEIVRVEACGRAVAPARASTRNLVTVEAETLLRSRIDLNLRMRGSSAGEGESHICFGPHPLGRRLEALGPRRVFRAEWAAGVSGLLMPPLPAARARGERDAGDARS